MPSRSSGAVSGASLLALLLAASLPAACEAPTGEPGDFDELDEASLATSAPGQSMQPGSPFYGNLLALWAEGEFFPLLFTPERVERAATHELILRPGR